MTDLPPWICGEVV